MMDKKGKRQMENEYMVFAPKLRNWEIAHKDGDAWRRRDGSPVCLVGRELSVKAMPEIPTRRPIRRKTTLG